MKYRFDTTRLTINDYMVMQPPSQFASVIGIAARCSLINASDIPITEITVFMEEFNKALADYLSTQFPVLK